MTAAKFPKPEDWCGPAAGVPGMGTDPVSVHQPGGDFINALLHPSLQPFEDFYQILADESWFNPNLRPSMPIKFDMGNFRVPRGMALVITEAEGGALRFSGIDPGAEVKVENWRFINQVGFEYLIDQTTTQRGTYQLQPQPVTNTAQPPFYQPAGQANSNTATFATEVRRTPDFLFDDARSRQFGSPSSAGTNLKPFWDRPHPGSINIPWMILAREGQVVSVRCTIFRPIAIPVVSMTYRHSGVIMHAQTTDAILARVRPR
jgi:hypothetical protein